MHMNQGIGAIRVPEQSRGRLSQAQEEHWFVRLDPEDCGKVGDASYYVRSSGQDLELWQISFDRSGVAFHERVDAGSRGITDEDLKDSVRMNRWSDIWEGFSPITDHIEKKLLILDIF
jgi:hypothetical protein